MFERKSCNQKTRGGFKYKKTKPSIFFSYLKRYSNTYTFLQHPHTATRTKTRNLPSTPFTRCIPCTSCSMPFVDSWTFQEYENIQVRSTKKTFTFGRKVFVVDLTKARLPSPFLSPPSEPRPAVRLRVNLLRLWRSIYTTQLA
jgi:hypothetical protein